MTTKVSAPGTDLSALVLSVSSSNPALLSPSSFFIGGSGTDRVLTIIPPADLSGSATITVTVTDSTGRSASDSFVFTIKATINTPPTISLTSPSNGASFTAPALIVIEASASDLDGIARVEFFQATTKLGEDTSAPYQFFWSNVPAGNYSLTAIATDNKGASATSPSVTITVKAAPIVSNPPIITVQPQSQNVVVGAAVTFTVTTTGTTPLSYQWTKNGVNIPGATGSALKLSNTTPTDAGDYTVTVSNSAGRVTSQPATLKVNVPSTALPTISDLADQILGPNQVTLTNRFTISDTTTPAEALVAYRTDSAQNPSPHSYRTASR